MTYFKSAQHIANFRQATDRAIEINAKKYEERKKLYLENPVRCKQCNEAIPYNKRHGSVFCSRSCSGTHNGKKRRHTEVSKNKISQALKIGSISVVTRKSRVSKAVPVEKTCAHCLSCFLVRAAKKKQKFCSKQCVLDYIQANEEVLSAIKEKGRENIEKQMASGKWKGWSGQGESKRSYPEKYVEDLLAADGLTEYDFQKQVGPFKIDFAFTAQKIALEVDGKQHEYPEGKARDARKEARLIAEGWTVLRIKWGRGVKKEEDKAALIRQYESFKNHLQTASKI